MRIASISSSILIIIISSIITVIMINVIHSNDNYNQCY